MAHTDDTIQGWFSGQLPDGWFVSAPEIRSDRDEILIVGTLPQPKTAADASEETNSAAASARIDKFREDSREARIRIAHDAEHLFGRKVSWGAACGDVRKRFTTHGAPVMTRLRMPEREVLDTLIDSGVARSRSEALAWCVRLVGKHQSEWLRDLREAMTHVEQVRAGGPDAAAYHQPGTMIATSGEVPPKPRVRKGGFVIGCQPLRGVWQPRCMGASKRLLTRAGSRWPTIRTHRSPARCRTRRSGSIRVRRQSVMACGTKSARVSWPS